MERYNVYCQVYRNGQLISSHLLVNFDPYECEDGYPLYEEEARLKATQDFITYIECSMNEENIKEYSIEGDIDSQFEVTFKEPRFGTEVVEIYSDFYLSPVLEPSRPHIHIELIDDSENKQDDDFIKEFLGE